MQRRDDMNEPVREAPSGDASDRWEEVVSRPGGSSSADFSDVSPGGLDEIILQGKRQVVRSVWGLIPSWETDRSGASKLINARAESLMVKPTFRSLIAGRRCIVPATGFTEWQGRGKDRQELYIHRKGGGPIALAGLWTAWRDPASGEEILSHTVITTSPNAMLARFHHRIPVILDGAAVDIWLDPAVTDPAVVLPLLQPAADDLLEATPIPKAINKERNDSPQLLLPLDGA